MKRFAALARTTQSALKRAKLSASSDGAAQNAIVVVAPGARPPRWLLGLQILYLVLLVAIGLVYVHQPAVHRFLPDPAGPVPLGVPWWGALGGITISLTGMFRHARRWESSYVAWHVARPFLGAIVGSVGFLVFIVVISRKLRLPALPRWLNNPCPSTQECCPVGLMT